MRDPLQQFQNTIATAGLTPPEHIEPDGHMHRFSSNGKRGDTAGWYRYFDGNIPGAVFGCWRFGLSQSWRADIGRKITPAEEAAHRSRMDAARKERAEAEAQERKEAAVKACAIWSAAEPAPDNHPYLLKKGIKPNGARGHEGCLVIPLRIGAEIHSLQRIFPDGDKRFLTGGRIAGCYFSIGGKPDSADALCICEGFATGASVHEATGYPVAIAFNAGNLLAVSQAMRQRFPEKKLILCADDDYRTEGNPGITKATEAAKAIGGVVAIPNFGRDSSK